MARGPRATAEMIVRFALGAVFVYAGALKAAAPAAFASAVFHFRLLPYPAAVAVALYLPWLEMVCGVGLLWRRTRLGALNLLLGLTLVFCGALASAWYRHLDIACGCFGGAADGPGTLAFSLARSALLAVVSAYLLGEELARLAALANAGAADAGRG